ncbi:AAA family ATPase [Cellvibrio sp. ARAG 10.3]|uniref:AAA family ATPase n=1 Tax=Cellvibrio sp. ARAG 10.3 TaxID=3451358 RepID=UPI003F477EEF
MALIEEIEFNNQNIRLAIPNSDDYNENYFSVIVGKNGVGKSRILSKIADSVMKTPYLFGGEFKKLIAISTSPFDKFKANYKTDNSPFSPRYSYIGIKSNGASRSPAISLIAAASEGIFENFLNQRGNVKLSSTFESLGFHPEVVLAFKVISSKDDRPHFYTEQILNTDEINKSQLKISAEPKYIKRSYMPDLFSIPESSDANKMETYRQLEEVFNFLKNYNLDASEKLISKLMGFNTPERYEIFDSMAELTSVFPRHKPFSVTLDFFNGLVLSSTESESMFNHHSERYQRENLVDQHLLLHIARLLHADIIQINDIRLKKMETGTLSLRRASSGEQCIMVIMLGIAGHIDNDTCILIDEPEISLHPEWQERFMDLVVNSFSDYKRCHFIVATHSPQIVSKLDSRNCFVTSLNSGQIYSSNYFQGKSSDFQLAEIFNSPGSNNEYIARLAFTLLSKIKHNKKVTDSDINEYKKLLTLRENIAVDDPVFHLIGSIKLVLNHYATDK